MTATSLVETVAGSQIRLQRRQIMEDETASVERSLATYRQARTEYIALSYRESVLEGERPAVLAAVIERLMQNGGLSYTAAERDAKRDDEYRSHLENVRQCTYEKATAETASNVALLQAKLAIARMACLTGGFV